MVPDGQADLDGIPTASDVETTREWMASRERAWQKYDSSISPTWKVFKKTRKAFTKAFDGAWTVYSTELEAVDEAYAAATAKGMGSLDYDGRTKALKLAVLLRASHQELRFDGDGGGGQCCGDCGDVWPCPTSCLLDEMERLRGVLDGVEWVASPTEEDGDPRRWCPNCFRYEPEHDIECPLRGALYGGVQ